jgi:hypothetical protein
MSVSGADAMRESDPGRFVNMLALCMEDESQTLEQIKTDLNRTFPTNIYFSKKDDPKSLVNPLHNVLYAFANDNPGIGYCQVTSFAFWLGLCLLFAVC